MKAIVTGGGGFVGGAIVRRLVERGDEVLSLSRGHYPELSELGVRSVRVDLEDGAATLAAMEPCDVVFHTAAKTGVFGPRASYFGPNLDGTRHVIAGCLERGIPRLVYTSSPSVCFDETDHIRSGNNLAYPRGFLAHYPESKARAEQLVLAANGRQGLSTCALRPHLVFGPGDPHLLPRLVERGRARKLAIIGSGRNEVSLTYIDNAAHAHILAADALTEGAPHAGRAYFIAQEEPVALWDWVRDLFERLSLPPVERRVPLRVARLIGGTLELAWTLLRKEGEPPMTRFVAAQLARSHSYDMEPARRDFGYREIVPLETAMDRTVADLIERGLCGSTLATKIPAEPRH